MDIVDDISIEKVKPTAAEDAAPADPFADIPDDLSPGETLVLLASRGLAVFPCEPDSKAPAITRGFLNASTKVRLSADHAWVHYTTADGERVYSVLVDDCNLAIEPGRAGFFVIDIDPKNGGDETWAELEAWHGRVVTRAVRTPSGGRHLWFYGTLPKVNKRLGSGIDTRCFGGYVLLPSSVIKGRQYRWVDPEIPIAPLPTWITEEFEVSATREAELLAAVRERIRCDEHEGDVFEGWLTLIGDHDGGHGFYHPMLRAAGAGVVLGMATDAILDRLREAALTADRHNHSLAEIQDRLSKMPGAIRSFQTKDAQRQRNADEEVVEEEELEELYEADDEFEELLAAQQAEASGKWTDETADAAEAGPRAAEAAGSAEQTAGPDNTAEETDEGAFESGSGWISAAQASDKLKSIVRDAFADPRETWQVLVTSPAGLGKTDAVINEALHHTTGWRPEDMGTSLLDQDLSYLPSEDRQVALAVPRHSLGDELRTNAEEKLAAADAYDKIPVMRGRSQGQCRRAKEAAALSAKGLPVYGNLCESKAGRCPFFNGCPHLAQSRSAAGAPIGIVMHTHLVVDKWEPSSDDYYWNLANSDVHVIDEAGISTLVEVTELTDTDITTLGELLGVDLIAELKPPGTLLTTLAGKDLTPDALRALAHKKSIAEAREGYVLNPASSDETLQEQIANLKPFRRLAPILERLADELASGRGGGSYSLILKDGKVISQGRRRLPAKKVLLLDATGNAMILRQFFPDLEETPPLNVRRNAHVTQVSDRTFSRRGLLVGGKATELLEQAKRFIALKAYEQKRKGGRLLVVTDRRVRALLTGETEEELKHPSGSALGADIAHFGNLRGSNDFKDHTAVIILGRDQPKLGRDQPKAEDAVQLAQAIWYDTPEPIKLAKRDAKGRINYAHGERNYQMRDGSTRCRKVSIQPDDRVQAVVEQVREGGMTQAIDRLRLLHNPEPKDVFILSSIPLDIEVDRLVTWEDLAGNHRLNKLLDTCAAEGLEAVPLTPGWLAERKLFRNPKSAENWLRSSQVFDLARNSINPENAIISIVMGNSGLFGAQASSATWEPKVATWRLVEYRPAGRRGKWSNAVVCGVDAQVAIASALGVPASAVELKAGGGTTQEASREPPPPGPEPTPDAAAAKPPDPDNPSETPRPAKPPWSVPLARKFILETPSHRCTWFLVDPRAVRPTKPLNFSSMLREEAGEGHLLSAADLGFTPDEPLHWMSADGAVLVLPYASLKLISGHMRAMH